MQTKRFELSRTKGMSVSTEDLISDIKRVAQELRIRTLTSTEYEERGEYSLTSVKRYLGGWPQALRAAELDPSTFESNISDELLFENIEQLWIKLGRQPRKRDLTKPNSKYSESPYHRRFASWRRALEEFVAFVNSEEKSETFVAVTPETITVARSSPREPSLRLRFLVMRRDSFKCQNCGKSPATHANVQLELDHNIPWSKGGQTTFENLRTLCGDCNRGKYNL
jgi:Homing endonuclease associated repeat/HNH endonuclease